MRRPLVTVIPIALATISAMLAIDLYLPAIPSLPHLLGGTPADAQYSLGAFMATFALGQLLFGVLGDRFDRRLVLRVALTTLALTSLLAGMAQSIAQLIGLRAVQGISASAGAALAPALLRDMAEGVAVIRLMGFVASMQAVVPAIAPAIGTWMVQEFGWRACFFTVTVMAGVAVSAFALFPKLPPKARAPGHPLAGYAALLSSRRYVGYVVSHGLGFGALLTFVLAAPYVVTTHAHAPITHFALMQLALVSCFAIGANSAPHVVRRLGSDPTILTGCSLQVIGGLGLFAVTATMHPITVPAMAACMAIVNLGHGLRGGVGLARVMDIMPGYTGSASALMVFISVGIGSIATPVIAPFLPLGAVVVGIAVATHVVLSLAVLPLALVTKPTATSAAE